MDSILRFFSFIGVYLVLGFAWMYFETMELGYTQITITDTVICMILAAFFNWIIWETKDYKGE